MRVWMLVVVLGLLAAGAGARTFYVSASSGDDAHDGLTEAAPVRSLAKVGAVRLEAGDRVLLRRGDVWREPFFPKGGGTPEAPVVMGAYGEGARPVIAPGRERVYALRIVDAGGFLISGLAFTDCYGGVVTWTERTYDHRYLRIEDCAFYEITGKDTGFSVLGGFKGKMPPDLLYGTGVSICGTDEFGGRTILSDITVTRCEFDRCDVGIEVIGRDYDPSGEWKEHGHKKISKRAFRNVEISDCVIRRSYRTGGVMLYCVEGGVARNVTVDETGYQGVGMWWGVAAFQVARVADFLVEGCTFSNTVKGHSPDGQGFDFESDCQNVTVRNCDFVNNDGPAVLYFGGTWAGKNAGNVIEGCRFRGNNRLREYGDVVFSVMHPDNEGAIRDCEIHLVDAGQRYAETGPIRFEASNKVYGPDGARLFPAEGK